METIFFRESLVFASRREKRLSPEEYRETQSALLDDPTRGAIIAGSGGCRKLRVKIGGRGKSGGARVIYYWFAPIGLVYLLDIFHKNEKSDLTRAETNELRALTAELKKEILKE